MKKILTTLLFLSIATIAIMGCSLIFGATYSYDTDAGYCVEVETSEIGPLILLEGFGAEKEPCDTTDVAATCTYESDEFNQEVTNYYSAEYLELSPDFAAELEADCIADDGEWLKL